MKYLILDQIVPVWIKFVSSPIITRTPTHWIYLYVHMDVCMLSFQLVRPMGKPLLTALHKYFYQNGKAFPSHPEHAKIPFAFPSLCRSRTLQYGPILLPLCDELNRSDGYAASPEAPGQVRKHTLLRA